MLAFSEPYCNGQNVASRTSPEDKAVDGSEPLYLRDFHDGTAADKVDKSALPKVRLDQESEVHVRFADFYRHSSGQAVGFLILRLTRFCLKTMFAVEECFENDKQCQNKDPG